ncbi:MAG: hypothetical protein KF760_03575 [Candidatus Eremiobacteraeota bacterium]|nr:hypothetical protein [Candidatus Eremiobacteraeota bacterium]MCW5872298.1 hypothetical protein [Candidatus Eremiobacteraeota bacterium]
MKRWAIGFFLCYPLLPVAFVCGLGLLEHRPFSLFAILYYGLLLSCSWNLRRLGGWAGRWYLLAFAVTCLHLSGVGGLVLSHDPDVYWRGKDQLMALVLLTILGVYLAATWAGSALAFRLKRPWEGVLQILCPILMLLGSGSRVGGPIFLLAFGGQAVHALLLSLKLIKQDETEELHIGLSPAQETN